jgi:hypothetical protein
MSAIISGLEGITVVNGYTTEVAYISEKCPYSFEQIDKSKLPAGFPIDTDEDKEQLVFGSTNNMNAKLKILITWIVFDKNNETRQARCDLLRDCEKAMMNDTTLAALILEIYPTKVTTDKGQIPNYSVFDQEFEISYLYSHADGG